jgi:hypothetical protein
VIAAPNRPPGRAFRRRLARLTREADARLAELHRREAGARGRRLIAAELLPMPEALADPALGGHAMEALAAAYGAAHRVGDGLMAECMTCRTPWTPDRSPAATLKIVTTKPDAMGLGLVCAACVDLGRAGFEATLGQALKRDFLGGGGELVSAAMVAPGGSA